MSLELHEAFRMVSDLDRSVAFYREALGLELFDRTSRRAEFDAGPCTLALEEDFDEGVLAEYGLSPPGDDRGGGTILVLRAESVEAAFERAVEAGARVLREPREEGWGEKLCLVADPDGYVVEIVRPTA